MVWGIWGKDMTTNPEGELKGEFARVELVDFTDHDEWQIICGEDEFAGAHETEGDAVGFCSGINTAHSQAVEKAVNEALERCAEIAGTSFEIGGYKSSECVDMGNEIAAEIRGLKKGGN